MWTQVDMGGFVGDQILCEAEASCTPPFLYMLHVVRYVLLEYKSKDRRN